MAEYCELALWGQWIEPFNAVSNLSFIVAGYFIWRLAERSEQKRQLYYLGVVAALVGLGSLAWHSYRSGLTIFLDSFFIAVYVLSIAFLLARHLFIWRFAPYVMLAALLAWLPIFTDLVTTKITFLENGDSFHPEFPMRHPPLTIQVSVSPRGSC